MSLSERVRERRKHYKAVEPLPPFEDDTWRTVAEVIIGIPVMLALLIGIPFLLWVIAGMVR